MHATDVPLCMSTNAVPIDRSHLGFWLLRSFLGLASGVEVVEGSLKALAHASFASSDLPKLVYVPHVVRTAVTYPDARVVVYMKVSVCLTCSWHEDTHTSCLAYYYRQGCRPESSGNPSC
jgi:hypothetical protein